MSVTSIGGSNPPYSLQSVLTAQITAERTDVASQPAAAPQPSTDRTSAQAAQAPSQSAILSTIGIGGSVNQQG